MANQCYDNRELSWMKFNERVLEEAADEKIPLWERLSFVAIYQSNLDEFFMVRVGFLHDQMLISEEIRENKTEMTCVQQLGAVLNRTKELGERKDAIYQEIMEKMKGHGLQIVHFEDLSKEEADYLEIYFHEEMEPLISPQVVGKRQPFPFLKNKEIYVILSLVTRGSSVKMGIIPCSGLSERLIAVSPEKPHFILAEELVLHFAPEIFERYRVKSKALIRITRNADIDEDEAMFDEDLDYRDNMKFIIRQRKKLCPVRLEVFGGLDRGALKILCKYLELTEKQVFSLKTPLDLAFVYQIGDMVRNVPVLFYPRQTPQNAPMVEPDIPMMEQISKKDILLSYPYESMRPFLRLLKEAAGDPSVISIKMTLYRVAKNSKVIESLVEAAENGKEVVVLVELRARFDEENNIEWSRCLENAGCRIIYGLDRIKVHSKLCLITRKIDGRIEYITQIGTGNYNEKTAKLYTDLTIMTASENIGEEAARVLNGLALGEVTENTRHLLVAPMCLQKRVLSMMDEEIGIARKGRPAYLGFKMNSLTDKRIIDKLIEASKAGVKIELLIRGICCLIAGSPTQTDHIRVKSIVGRYLEHSRVYIFGLGGRRKIYISSADFMTRNTLRRVEVAAPVEDKDIQKKIEEMFKKMMQDNEKAWIQNPDGTYRKSSEELIRINSQELFFRMAYKNNILK